MREREDERIDLAARLGLDLSAAVPTGTDPVHLEPRRASEVARALSRAQRRHHRRRQTQTLVASVAVLVVLVTLLVVLMQEIRLM